MTDYAKWLRDYADELGDLSDPRLIKDEEREHQANIRAAAAEIERLRRWLMGSLSAHPDTMKEPGCLFHEPTVYCERLLGVED